MTPTRLDSALRALSTLPVPSPSPALESALRRAGAVPRRRPARALAAIALAGTAIAALHAFANGLRKDMELLPAAWIIAVGAAWLMLFAVPLALIMVPARASVLADPRRTAISALLAPIGALVLGVTFAADAAPPPVIWSDGLLACLFSGIELAAVPFVAAGLAMRRALPVDARPLGAALGAACGALGGFALHLQCEIGGPLHVGLAHGGAAVLGAVAGYAVFSRRGGAR